ncbi:MAG TPA: M61 family peptidase [Terriglobales bacterium]|nr:M61 family peptidase [Terriglobales bacterium]
MISVRCYGLLIAILVTPSFFAAQTTPQSAPPTITVSVDATDAQRKIFHAHLTIPATPGSLTLYYPKWIPGEHGPTGPIEELTGLRFTGNGQVLNWRRDLLDGWTFHVDVPQGVSLVEASLDYVSPTGRDGLYTGALSATDKITEIAWNTLILYPAGWTSDELSYETTLRLPTGWKSGTALPIASQSGPEIKFKPASLTTLVDSPVIAGEYMRVVPLAENPRQEMDIAADSAAALDVPADLFDPYKNLTDQAFKLFGARHFRDYHFLYSLSDHVAHFGLEHHESNDSRSGERYLVDPELRLLAAGLLPHEYVHSWNGKYRRPADLTTPNYEDPMKDDLLWVYEGLTSYLGDVLSARSGLRTPEQLRDSVALIAAKLDHTPGRTWRNLQDTADGVPSMQGAPPEWESWRRDLDYYDEDVLNWLWVDTIVRQQTAGKKSIDDFCHLFHGGESGLPEVKTYTFDDVMNALNQVAPYDWAGFWTVRLTNHTAGAPLGGIEGSGWKLVYDETRSELFRDEEHEGDEVNASYSIGLLLKEDGRIVDTIEGMPAAQAGIGPGMKLVAVNGRRFSGDVLRDALRAGKNGSEPLQLLIENTDYFRTSNLNYHGGEKYPHLVRDGSRPDLLTDIIRPR